MIIPSCGHPVEDHEDILTLSLKTWNDFGSKRAVSFGCYCPECANKLMGHPSYLPNDDAELEWLEGYLAYHEYY